MKRAVLVAAVLLATAASALAEPRRITLPEAIRLASDGNVEVAVGREQVAAAEARVRGARATRLPSLGVKANVFVWNAPIELVVAPGAPPIVARGQITSSAEVSLVQPISGALVIGKLIELEQRGRSAREVELERIRLDLAYRAAEGYLTALQARTLQEIAATSVTQIEANLVRARALRTGGVLFDVDVLRLEAQRDALLQQVLEAEAGFEIARRGLALVLGLPHGTELELEVVDTTPPELTASEDDAVAEARKRRPEIRAAELGVEQARLGIDVQRAAYFPNVNAIASYSHTEGQGAFAIKDSAFLGVTLDWNLWDWGKRGSDVAQARSTARQAQLSRDALLDRLAIDVRTKWLQASTRRKTVGVAESGLRAAEEAHRLQNVRFEAGSATTTDVIDAETEVSRARAQATIARYQYLIAWMALVRAVGQTPDLSNSPQAPRIP